MTHVNCLVLCTSPLQLVIARSAMDVLSEKDGCFRKAYGIIIHPLLGENSKTIIRAVGGTLAYESVEDYTLAYQRLTAGRRVLSAVQSKPDHNFRSRARNLVEKFKMIQGELSTAIAHEIGQVDEVFCRQASRYCQCGA